MTKSQRWALLEHVGALDDPVGRHFDLMLEDKSCCRSWRLSDVPILDGPSVQISKTPSHKLEWLDREYVSLSEGRGIVTRLEAGKFTGELPASQDSYIKIRLQSKSIIGEIEIQGSSCRLISGK